MRVLEKEPKKRPVLKEVENELKPLQEIVGGGNIECVSYRSALVICNEEGKLRGMNYNFPLNGDVIVGTAIFVDVEGDDFTDIKDGQIEAIMKDFEREAI